MGAVALLLREEPPGVVLSVEAQVVPFSLEVLSISWVVS